MVVHLKPKSSRFGKQDSEVSGHRLDGHKNEIACPAVCFQFFNMGVHGAKEINLGVLVSSDIRRP